MGGGSHSLMSRAWTIVLVCLPALAAACSSPPKVQSPESQVRVNRILAGYEGKDDLSGFVGVPLDTLTNPDGQTKEGERKAEWLEIGVGAQILRDLGVSRIRIIAGREVDYVGIEGFGLTLEATELLTD